VFSGGVAGLAMYQQLQAETLSARARPEISLLVKSGLNQSEAGDSRQRLLSQDNPAGRVSMLPAAAMVPIAAIQGAQSWCWIMALNTTKPTKSRAIFDPKTISV
jgi:hypothetical protein